MRVSLVPLDFIVGIVISLLAVIGPAAASQSHSGCVNNHCFQFQSAGPCFIPSLNTPASSACFDANLKLVLTNHVASEDHTPANGYWHPANGTFLGDVLTYRVDSPVSICHTGPLPTGRYYSTCRETVRDDDWDDAAKMPSCSIVHDNGEPLRRSGCVIPQTSNAGLSPLSIALAFVAFSTVPAAYIQYAKDVQHIWRIMYADPIDIELGALDEARIPFHHLFRLAIEFGIFSVGTHGFVNDVAGYLGRFAGRMQEVFNLDRVVGALAQVVVLRGQRHA